MGTVPGCESKEMGTVPSCESKATGTVPGCVCGAVDMGGRVLEFHDFLISDEGSAPVK